MIKDIKKDLEALCECFLEWTDENVHLVAILLSSWGS